MVDFAVFFTSWSEPQLGQGGKFTDISLLMRTYFSYPYIFRTTLFEAVKG